MRRSSVVALSLRAVAVTGLLTTKPKNDVGWDFFTVPYCSYFYYDESKLHSCEQVRDTFSASSKDFTRWNPLVSEDCKPWYNITHCVRVDTNLLELDAKDEDGDKYGPPLPRETVAVQDWAYWDYLGCYADALSKADSKFMANASGTNLTGSNCEETCFGEGYNYSGRRNGDECWCSNKVIIDYTKYSFECDILCAGFNTDRAGWPDRLCGGKGLFTVLGKKDAKVLLEMKNKYTSVERIDASTKAPWKSASSRLSVGLTSGSVGLIGLLSAIMVSSL